MVSTRPKFKLTGESKFDPWKGQRIRAAWRAALDLLTAAEWVAFDDLRSAMMAAGAIQSQTVSTMLREARRVKAIKIRGQYNYALKCDAREAKLIAEDGHAWLDNGQR